MKRSHYTAVALTLSSLAAALILTAPALAKNPPQPSPPDIMGWITFAIGTLGALFGTITWYRGAVEQSFAAKRSFEHLRKNQEQMGQALTMLGDQCDDISNDLKMIVRANTEIEHELDLIKMQATEAKGTMMTTLQQVQILSSKIDGNSGWTRT